MAELCVRISLLTKTLLKSRGFALSALFILISALLLVHMHTVMAVVEISDGSVIGLWNKEGGSLDSSGNGHHGTDTNVTYGVGKLGDAGTYVFASSSLTAITSTAALDFSGHNQISINAWIYRTDASKYVIPLAKRVGSGGPQHSVTVFL
jgi:hypothetical protein